MKLESITVILNKEKIGETMRKIAIYQYDFGIGGIQKSLINLLTNLDTEEYDIDLFLFQEEIFYDVHLPSNVHLHFEKPFSKVARFIPFNLVKKMYKNPNKKEYDIAIDFNSYQMETAVYALQTNAKRKYIWLHNDVVIKLKEEKKYRILWFFFKSKFAQFDEVCAVSNGVKTSLNEQLGIPLNRIRVLPNYIDTSEIIEKAKESVDFKVDPLKLNLCTLGRLTHQKGIDIALDDISKLTKIRQDFHFYIIGDGEEEDSLKQQTTALNLDSYVTFLGRKQNPFSYMNTMDIFLLTSRYEGQGMVLLEAKTLGLSIVMPKHLEKYIDDVEGVDDVLATLSNISKPVNKNIDPLVTYNQNILDEFSKL